MEKELYFTPKTNQKKADELLGYVNGFRRRHADEVIHPKQAALLVLDMQNYFLLEDSHAFVPSASTIIPGINKLISAFMETEQPVIATRHINTNEDAGMMSTWWRDLIDPESAHSQIATTLDVQNAIHLDKTQYDAFLNTALEGTLRNFQVKQVVITGVMTHLCCESTARSAFMRGFEVFFAIDGTATYNEDLHRASLLTLSHGFAVPVLVEEILEKLEFNAS